MKRRHVVVAVGIATIVLGGGLLLHFLIPAAVTRQLSPADIAARLQGLDPQSKRAIILRDLSERSGQASGVPQGTGPRVQVDTVALIPPAVYELRSETGGTESDKHSKVLIAGIGGTRRLVISEESFSGPLGDFPSIKMRRIQPDTYAEKAIIIGDREVLEFTNTQTEGFEKVIFYLNEGTGRLTTLALTTTTAFGREEAAADYGHILTTIEWW